MTQEDKNLLLKDLCARLPYNMFVEKDGRKCAVLSITNDGEVEIERGFGYHRYYDVQDVRPYLRPMSSMTEEEKEDYNSKFEGREFSWEIYYGSTDWLNAHHFDFRGLIPMGLALEAPDGMYK